MRHCCCAICTAPDPSEFILTDCARCGGPVKVPAPEWADRDYYCPDCREGEDG